MDSKTEVEHSEKLLGIPSRNHFLNYFSLLSINKSKKSVLFNSALPPSQRAQSLVVPGDPSQAECSQLFLVLGHILADRQRVGQSDGRTVGIVGKREKMSHG